MGQYKKPRIGLVTDCDLNRHRFRQILSAGGYELVLSLDSAKLIAGFDADEAAIQYALDAWLIDLKDDAVEPALQALVDIAEIPLLVNDSVPPAQDIEAYKFWQRRLLKKLEEVAVCTNPAKTENAKSNTAGPALAVVQPPHADKVWVLAASMGGPAAVKRFFNALPAQLPIALVYGQHIETNFDGLLIGALGNQHSYPVRLIKGQQCLVAGEVFVVSVDHQLRFLPRGRVVEMRAPWAGAYQPSLDQVISELARVYRDNLGVIIFSGMCNDGEIGCRVAKASGGTVWAQSPDSCLSPGMPNAAINTGCVSFQGAPEQLAAALVEYVSATTMGSSSSAGG
ncbi:MAG: chemotaxis protein CheB [Spongiibacteraceae bacterium]